MLRIVELCSRVPAQYMAIARCGFQKKCLILRSKSTCLHHSDSRQHTGKASAIHRLDEGLVYHAHCHRPCRHGVVRCPGRQCRPYVPDIQGAHVLFCVRHLLQALWRIFRLCPQEGQQHSGYVCILLSFCLSGANGGPLLACRAACVRRLSLGLHCPAAHATLLGLQRAAVVLDEPLLG